MKNNTSNTPEVKSVSAGSNKGAMPFSRQNYVLMLVGVGLILLGFFVMTMDKEEFGFGFLGITLGPAITFIGFIFEFYAIFKKK